MLRPCSNLVDNAVPPIDLRRPKMNAKETHRYALFPDDDAPRPRKETGDTMTANDIPTKVTRRPNYSSDHADASRLPDKVPRLKHPYGHNAP